MIAAGVLFRATIIASPVGITAGGYTSKTATSYRPTVGDSAAHLSGGIRAQRIGALLGRA